MTSQSGPDQPPLYFRPTYALTNQGLLIADLSIFPEREKAGVDQLSGVNGPLLTIQSLTVYITEQNFQHFRLHYISLNANYIGPSVMTDANCEFPYMWW